MADYLSRLIRTEEIAEGTLAFYLEKPTDLSYQAGQHPTVQIVNPIETDSEGDNRTLSFTSIPSDKEVSFATRLRDTAFKRILQKSSPGLEMMIKNPRGSMVLPEQTERILVFLAGGIGITPFISLIREATKEKSDQKIILFYSNKTLSQAPFFKKLQELAEENPNFTFVPTFTQEKDWNGETGRINSDLIRKYVKNPNDNTYYLAGPTAMVDSLRTELAKLKVDPLFIKSEDYGEYK